MWGDPHRDSGAACAWQIPKENVSAPRPASQVFAVGRHGHRVKPSWGVKSGPSAVRVSTRQSRTVPSRLAETSRWSSGVKVTALTGFSCLGNVARILPVRGSRVRTLPRKSPTANCFPSCEKAAARMAVSCRRVQTSRLSATFHSRSSPGSAGRSQPAVTASVLPSGAKAIVQRRGTMPRSSGGASSITIGAEGFSASAGLGPSVLSRPHPIDATPRTVQANKMRIVRRDMAGLPREKDRTDRNLD